MSPPHIKFQTSSSSSRALSSTWPPIWARQRTAATQSCGKATCYACPPYNTDTTLPVARFRVHRIHAAPELHTLLYSSPSSCRRTHRAPPRCTRAPHAPVLDRWGSHIHLLPTSFTQAGALSHLLGTERVTSRKCQERKRSCGCVALRTTASAHATRVDAVLAAGARL